MQLPDRLEVSHGICRFRPRGECTLVEAVDLISAAIAYCRVRHLDKLLINVTGVTGLPIPTLVDRFLMVEDWARAAKGMTAVALVAHAEYIHPQKFGVRVAADLGLTANVHTSEADAIAWLSGAAGRA